MIDVLNPLVLGSGSPRRRDLLSDLGIPFVARPADIDEERQPGERPEPYVERIVATKLRGVTTLLGDERPNAAVLVADTIVVVDGAAIGKPRDVEEARHTLSRLVGRRHVVLTRYAVAHSPRRDTPARARTVRSEVEMREASDDEIRRYAGSGEGLDKAGAYAVQGLGAFLVRGIFGSYTNVVGLPVCELVSDLMELGLLRDFPASALASGGAPSGTGAL